MPGFTSAQPAFARSTPPARDVPAVASVGARTGFGCPSVVTGTGRDAGGRAPSSTSPKRCLPDSTAGEGPAPPTAPNLSMAIASAPQRMLLMAAFAESWRTFMMLEMALCSRLSFCIAFWSDR